MEFRFDISFSFLELLFLDLVQFVCKGRVSLAAGGAEKKWERKGCVPFLWKTRASACFFLKKKPALLFN